VKTQIDIIADKKIITVGMKIESSHAALLDKLKIRPFHYKMNIKSIYDHGVIMNAAILDISTESILAKFQKACTNMACVSLETGYVTKPAIPHMMMNAFKNLVSVTFDSSVTFKQADKIKASATKAPEVKGAPAKQEAKKEVVVEEKEEDVDMGNMFGDDDY